MKKGTSVTASDALGAAEPEGIHGWTWWTDEHTPFELWKGDRNPLDSETGIHAEWIDDPDSNEWLRIEIHGDVPPEHVAAVVAANKRRRCAEIREMTE